MNIRFAEHRSYIKKDIKLLNSKLSHIRKLMNELNRKVVSMHGWEEKKTREEIVNLANTYVLIKDKKEKLLGV